MPQTVFATVTPLGVARVLGKAGPISFRQETNTVKNTRLIKIPHGGLAVGEGITIEFSNAPAIEYRQIAPGSYLGHGTTATQAVAVAARLLGQESGYRLKPGAPKQSDIAVERLTATQAPETLTLSLAWVETDTVSKDRLATIVQALAGIEGN